MRAFLIAGVGIVGAFTAADAIEIDGVKIKGRMHDVTVADIREAITTGIGPGATASEVDIMSSKEMRVYLAPRDLGWILVTRQKIPLPEPPDYRIVTRMRWESTGKGIDDSDILTVIRGANEAFVFPVATPDKPHRDNRHLRLLDPEARRKVVHLLGNRVSWWQGGYTLISPGPEPPNVGLVFRRGRDEVVLFFESGFYSYTGHVKGTLNGQHASGLLEKKQSKQMQEWRRRYAQPELASR
jgi:hypothetical protein